MKRKSFIILTILSLFSIFLKAQQLSINFNNTKDSKTYTQDLVNYLSNIKGELRVAIESQPNYTADDLSIDIIFLDKGYVGNLKLINNHNAENLLIKDWKTKYDDELRILLYFVKENNVYSCKDLVITIALQNAQIPELVLKYIKENIYFKNGTDYKICTYNTIKAFKNAFDASYKNKIIEKGSEMRNCKYYYKGYAYIDVNYFQFEPTYTSRDNRLSLTLFYQSNNEYYPVFLSEIKDSRATVFDYLIGHPLCAKLGEGYFYDLLGSYDNSIYTSLSSGGYILLSELDITFDKMDLFSFSNGNYTTIESMNDFSKLKEFCVSIQNFRKFMDILPDASNDNYLYLVETENLLRVNSKYLITIGQTHRINRSLIGIPQEPDPVNKKIGWSVGIWGTTYSFGQATWCNWYTADLSDLAEIYGVPSGKTASQQKKYFISNSNLGYINLKTASIPTEISLETYIWRNLVDNGYPVYFSSSSHIETAFPSGSTVEKSNRRYFEDINGNYALDPSSSKLTIGGGGHTGFKSYNEYPWLQGSGTMIFLYLGHLDD